MPKKRIHRVAVYLLDNDRKRLLLCRNEEGPFAGLYTPLCQEINAYETPVETARNLVREKTSLNFKFLGYETSMPMVLDEFSVKTYPPLHIQITHLDDKTDYVDYVYLGQVKAAPEFRDGGPLCWFSQTNTKMAPNYVKNLVNYLLALTV